MTQQRKWRKVYCGEHNLCLVKGRLVGKQPDSELRDTYETAPFLY